VTGARLAEFDVVEVGVQPFVDESEMFAQSGENELAGGDLISRFEGAYLDHGL